MAEYIDRQAVIDLVDKGYLVSNSNYGSVSRIVRQIPAADVQPVKRGRWEDVEVTDVSDKTILPLTSIVSMRCSECGRYHNEVYYYGCATENVRFCPNCGARTDGET